MALTDPLLNEALEQTPAPPTPPGRAAPPTGVICSTRAST